MPGAIARRTESLPANHESPPWRRLSWALLEYRVPSCATIVLVALASIFVLTSQSASSWPTYILGAYVLAGAGRWRTLFLDRGFLLIVVLLAYIPLSSLWSTPWDAREAFSQVSRALLVFTFVVCIAESVQVDWFVRRITQTMAVFGALAAGGAIAFFFIESPDDGRLNGLGQLDTHVMAAMVYAFAAVCGLAWLASDDRGVGRWISGVCVAVLVVAVFLSGSRNAMACLVFGLGCLLIASRVTTARAFLVAAGSLAVGLLTVILAAYWLVSGAGEVILPRGDSFRPAIWMDYLARIRADGIWFGLGVLTPDLIQVGGYDVLHPHNLYLAVTLQSGLLGLALMVTVITATLHTLVKHYDEPEAKLALAVWAMALPGYLLDGHELVDKVGWTWLLFWLPVGIGLGIRARRGLEDARRFGVDARRGDPCGRPLDPCGRPLDPCGRPSWESQSVRARDGTSPSPTAVGRLLVSFARPNLNSRDLHASKASSGRYPYRASGPPSPRYVDFPSRRASRRDRGRRVLRRR